MIYVLLVLLILVVCIFIFLWQPQFGALPKGKLLNSIKLSPEYKDGQFQNIHFTPMLKEGVGYGKVFYEFFFNKAPNNIPPKPLPSIKTDLLNLDANENVLVWFGHSSYFIKVDGKNILVDPVFSGHASPVNFTTKSFAGSDVYGVDDMPDIDILILTHDHWDHLDYDTVLKLKPKVKQIITGLGVSAHLERWEFNKNIIFEKDWYESIALFDNFIIRLTPARHFSGRGLKRNKSIWSSFVLQTPQFNLFIGGDSGYDTHFKDIGDSFGPFDLALLECGQYNEYWKYIHMLPEEVVKAAGDLKAKTLLPVHWAKFSLSIHAWDEPIKRVTIEAEKQNMNIITPMIGEKVDLKQLNNKTKWWQAVNTDNI